ARMYNYIRCARGCRRFKNNGKSKATGKIYIVLSAQRIRKAIQITKVLTGKGGQNDYVRAGISAAKTIGASARHASHLLWLQVTGSFFVFFAVIGSMAGVREYQRWQTAEIGPQRFCAAIIFSAAFAYFGISSFLQARKLEREKANGSRSR
ncbi:MAG TPA: hypothetical protein VF493_16680, partial [Terriglobales bacterium]